MRGRRSIAGIVLLAATAVTAVLASRLVEVRWRPDGPTAGRPVPAAATMPERLAVPLPATAPDSHRITILREFRDPFYAFLIGIAEGDSLGIWTREHLRDFLDGCGRESQLPLDHLESIERRAVHDEAAERLRGVRAQRVWRLSLREPLRYPMPYSVLGHSLGSLSVASVLIFSEWRLGDRNVYAPRDGQVDRVPVTGLTVFRLDGGWIVMDVDGLLDKLLGGKLDDCWTQGFAICRHDGVIRGLALSWNRDLRPLTGEIDFATNEISPGGGPFARGVAVVVRPWVVPDDRSRLWNYDD